MSTVSFLRIFVTVLLVSVVGCTSGGVPILPLTQPTQVQQVVIHRLIPVGSYEYMREVLLEQPVLTYGDSDHWDPAYVTPDGERLFYAAPAYLQLWAADGADSTLTDAGRKLPNGFVINEPGDYPEFGLSWDGSKVCWAEPAYAMGNPEISLEFPGDLTVCAPNTYFTPQGLVRSAVVLDEEDVMFMYASWYLWVTYNADDTISISIRAVKLVRLENAETADGGYKACSDEDKVRSANSRLQATGPLTLGDVFTVTSQTACFNVYPGKYGSWALLHRVPLSVDLQNNDSTAVTVSEPAATYMFSDAEGGALADSYYPLIGKSFVFTEGEGGYEFRLKETK